MNTNRIGEDRNIPFRTERYFCSNGEWYFLTRGGGQQGPFINKSDMEGELMLYIRAQHMANNTISN